VRVERGRKQGKGGGTLILNGSICFFSRQPGFEAGACESTKEGGRRKVDRM